MPTKKGWIRKTTLMGRTAIGLMAGFALAVLLSPVSAQAAQNLAASSGVPDGYDMEAPDGL